MKEQFLDYEHSKMMKELGLVLTGLDDHNEVRNSISHPTWMQVKEWIWEKHKIIIMVVPDNKDGSFAFGIFNMNFTTPQEQLI